MAVNKNKVPPELVPFCEALAELLASDYLINESSEKIMLKEKLLKILPSKLFRDQL